MASEAAFRTQTPTLARGTRFLTAGILLLLCLSWNSHQNGRWKEKLALGFLFHSNLKKVLIYTVDHRAEYIVDFIFKNDF